MKHETLQSQIMALRAELCNLANIIMRESGFDRLVEKYVSTVRALIDRAEKE